jgi:hypothetical protein
MLVASTSMFEINRLAQLVRTFDMKDLGATKQILGMEIHRDRKDGKLWLSQQKYVVKILRKFGMNNVKPVKSLWLSIVSFLQVYVLTNEEEKGYMSRVSYASRKFDVCDEMVSISHAVGVVSRHMEKPGEEHGNGC